MADHYTDVSIQMYNSGNDYFRNLQRWEIALAAAAALPSGSTMVPLPPQPTPPQPTPPSGGGGGGFMPTAGRGRRSIRPTKAAVATAHASASSEGYSNAVSGYSATAAAVGGFSDPSMFSDAGRGVGAGMLLSSPRIPPAPRQGSPGGRSHGAPAVVTGRRAPRSVRWPTAMEG